jgi:hypothetical protein
MKKNLPLLIATFLVIPVSAEVQRPTPSPAPEPAKPTLPPVSADLSPAEQAEQYYRHGQVAEKAGNVDAARAAYEAALKANPKHANARYGLGQLKINGPAITAMARETKFGAVVIPVFKVDAASLKEALDALQIMVEKESKEQVTPNFIIQDPKGQLADTKVSLNVKSMPAKAVLSYLMDQAKAKATFDQYAIVIAPK